MGKRQGECRREKVGTEKVLQIAPFPDSLLCVLFYHIAYVAWLDLSFDLDNAAVVFVGREEENLPDAALSLLDIDTSGLTALLGIDDGDVARRQESLDGIPETLLYSRHAVFQAEDPDGGNGLDGLDILRTLPDEQPCQGHYKAGNMYVVGMLLVPVLLDQSLHVLCRGAQYTDGQGQQEEDSLHHVHSFQ